MYAESDLRSNRLRCENQLPSIIGKYGGRLSEKFGFLTGSIAELSVRAEVRAGGLFSLFSQPRRFLILMAKNIG